MQIHKCEILCSKSGDCRKTTVYWDVMSPSLVVLQFGKTQCLNLQGQRHTH